MRIVIDLQGLQSSSRFRGIGRYSSSITEAIIKNSKHHEIILVCNGILRDSLDDIIDFFSKILSRKNIKVWNGYGSVSWNEKNNFYIREVNELLREVFIASLEPDVVFVTSVVEGYIDDVVMSINKFITLPTSVIFYDVIPLIQSQKYIEPNGEKFKQYYYDRINNFKEAEFLFGISNSACQEAKNYLGIDSKKLINIKAAVDSKFVKKKFSNNEIELFKQKFGIKERFLLYSGATDDRKNHIGLIKAYAKLSKKIQEEYQLVIAGGMPYENLEKFKKVASQCQLYDKIIFTERVSDEELVALYNLCSLFVFPSWHEGFGLPVLEAMNCGAPVIGSNTTSIPEIIGRDDALFDPFDEKDIANKITEILVNDKFREELITNSLEQSKKFSWDKSAKIIIETFEKYYIDKKSKEYKKEIDYIPFLINNISRFGDQLTEQDLLNISQCIARNHPENSLNQNQLFVDVSELVQRDAKSGIQRVVKAILKELLVNPPKGYRVEPVYADTQNIGYKYARKFTARFLNNQTILEDEIIDFHAGDIFFGLDLQPGIVSFQKDFYYEMRLKGVKIYFVVYDLLCSLQSNYFPHGAKRGFENWLNIVLKNDGVLCISSAVSDEVREYIKNHNVKICNEFLIDWFHLGADIDNSNPSKGLPENANEVLDKLKNSKTFLMVGTIEPRKGHKQTLEAFEKLWSENIDINLVIVGKQGWMMDEFIAKVNNHLELNKRLFWLEGISDEYLGKVYDTSTCLIAASEGEGFGLPLIEAAQKKLPIIARDIPVFREVADEFAYYFENSNESQVIVDSIKEWLELYKNGEHIKSDNMPWLTWKESAEKLLKCILNKESLK